MKITIKLTMNNKMKIICKAKTNKKNLKLKRN